MRFMEMYQSFKMSMLLILSRQKFSDITRSREHSILLKINKLKILFMVSMSKTLQYVILKSYQNLVNKYFAFSTNKLL